MNKNTFTYCDFKTSMYGTWNFGTGISLPDSWFVFFLNYRFVLRNVFVGLVSLIVCTKQFQVSFCRNSRSEQEIVVETITEEIIMMTKLNHPNVVRIMGATRHGCHFNMFVEWMPGRNFAIVFRPKNYLTNGRWGRLRMYCMHSYQWEKRGPIFPLSYVCLSVYTSCISISTLCFYAFKNWFECMIYMVKVQFTCSCFWSVDRI